MDTLVRRLLCLTACLPLGFAIAADFDGSRPLICAPTEAVDLYAGEEIVKARPNDIGAPSFLRVDIANKTIAGPKRVTPIKYVEKDDMQILLQGTELGFGWTLALDQQEGAMTITFVDRAGAVVLSGTCTPI
ncbi:MAG: hypothetical protein JWM42_3353 [Burkholderia sp.]|nr:hypothetical protein [Burkholderia sp.]